MVTLVSTFFKSGNEIQKVGQNHPSSNCPQLDQLERRPMLFNCLTNQRIESRPTTERETPESKRKKKGSREGEEPILGPDETNEAEEEEEEEERTRKEAETKSRCISAGVLKHHMDQQRIMVGA